MNITLQINGNFHDLEIPASTTLLAALRGLGFHSVKFGDEHGQTGADTVLLDGRPVNAGILLAAQAAGVFYRGWGHPVRILHPGAVTRRQVLAGHESKPDRSRSAGSHRGSPVSLYGVCEAGTGYITGGSPDEGGGPAIGRCVLAYGRSVGNRAAARHWP